MSSLSSFSSRGENWNGDGAQNEPKIEQHMHRYGNGESSPWTVRFGYDGANGQGKGKGEV